MQKLIIEINNKQEKGIDDQLKKMCQERKEDWMITPSFKICSTFTVNYLTYVSSWVNK